jgi:inosine-uridine nucleoside N-ribohydrolase
MGGGLPYHVPNRAEHNIRLDISAAQRVLAAVGDGRLTTPEFVTSDVTFTPEIAVQVDHPIHLALAAEPQPWAQILLAHLARCYATEYPSTIQHDPLALSAALELPFVTSGLSPIALDENGCMTIDDQAGVTVRVSRHADYPAFMSWLNRSIDPAIPATAFADAPSSTSTDQTR